MNRFKSQSNIHHQTLMWLKMEPSYLRMKILVNGSITVKEKDYYQQWWIHYPYQLQLEITHPVCSASKIHFENQQQLSFLWKLLIQQYSLCFWNEISLTLDQWEYYKFHSHSHQQAWQKLKQLFQSVCQPNSSGNSQSEESLNQHLNRLTSISKLNQEANSFLQND